MVRTSERKRKPRRPPRPSQRLEPADSRRKAPELQPWAHLRLQDRIAPGVRVLFVGINPGVRSAETGHHFAGYSNRFWKLLYDSGLVPEPISSRDDGRLPEWGYGMTNLISRPSRGIDDLAPGDYAAGAAALARKVRRFRPAIVALVGLTLYRRLFPAPARATVRPGLTDATFHGARVFVLPNPSGRNANFSYAEMLAAFVALKRRLDGLPSGSRDRSATRSG
jgi:TDG/mug DNA glycosylase family protein